MPSLLLEQNSVLNVVRKMTKSAESHKCPSCGGEMAYSPDKNGLACEYCDNVVELIHEDVEIIENDFFEYKNMEGIQWSEEDAVVTINCESCGSELVMNANTVADFCSYCGSSHISKDEGSDLIKPNYLVPFKIPRDKAITRFKDWTKGKFFAPSSLKNEAKNSKLEGIYLPYWTYDSDVYTDYKASRGDYYYVTRTRTVDGKTQTYQERRTRWTRVSGDYSKFYDDVTVQAYSQFNTSLIEKIKPFDLTELVPYGSEYLAGFFAQKYSIDLDKGWIESKSQINNDLQSCVKRKIGGDVVSGLNLSTSYSNVTFKHVLLPLWVSSYDFKGKMYNFYVNGQTGEVQGEYPKSVVKIAATAILALGLGYLAYRYLM